MCIPSDAPSLIHGARVHENSQTLPRTEVGIVEEGSDSGRGSRGGVSQDWA